MVPNMTQTLRRSTLALNSENRKSEEILLEVDSRSPVTIPASPDVADPGRQQTSRSYTAPLSKE